MKYGKNAGSLLLVLVLCLLCCLVPGAGACAAEQDQKIQTGKWITPESGEGTHTSRLKFQLTSAADITVAIKNVTPVKGSSGSFRVLLDSGNDPDKELFGKTVSKSTIFTGMQVDHKLAKGSHYLTVELKNIDSFSIKVTVGKTYPNPAFTVGENRKISLGKWVAVSPGKSGTGKVRFELKTPGDIKISLRNVVSQREWKNHVSAFREGKIKAYYDCTVLKEVKNHLIDSWGTGTLIKNQSWTFEEVPAGVHYVYFELENTDPFEIKVSQTKKYATGPATRIRLDSPKKMAVGTTLKMEPELVEPFETLTGMKWSSSDTRIVTVNQKGVVTAKKAGEARVTCTLKNGKKYNCRIVVKKNAASHKASFADVKEGEVVIDWTSLTYKGKNLVMEATCYNRTAYTVSRYDWIEIFLSDGKGNDLASKKFTKVKLNMKPYAKKKLVFTFPAASVKQKNCDLTAAKPGMSFSYYYIYIDN